MKRHNELSYQERESRRKDTITSWVSGGGLLLCIISLVICGIFNESKQDWVGIFVITGLVGFVMFMQIFNDL